MRLKEGDRFPNKSRKPPNSPNQIMVVRNPIKSLLYIRGVRSHLFITTKNILKYNYIK